MRCKITEPMLTTQTIRNKTYELYEQINSEDKKQLSGSEVSIPGYKS